MTQKYICVARCPELDDEGSKHCVDTKEGIAERTEVHCDYCPCGNNPVWEPITDNRPYSDKDYEEAKAQGLDLDDWNDYVKFYGLGEREEYD